MSVPADQVTGDGAGNFEINLGGQPTTTTAEAQKYARTILDKQIGGGNEKGEAAILDEMEDNSRRAIANLRAAQQSIAGMNMNPAIGSNARAAALLAPTRSGSTSEGLSNAFTANNQTIKDQQEYDLNRMKSILDYQQKIVDAPDAITKAKLELQKLHEQQQGPLGKEALSVMGRSIIPGQGQLSNFDKIAAGEGYPVGTPQHIRRVRELVAQDLRNKRASAGTDAEDYTEPDHSQRAYELGVPDTAPYPWEGVDTKTRKQQMQAERTAANKELATLQAAVPGAQQVQRDLDRFGFLNTRTATSSLQGVPGVNFITGFGQDAKEMDKISSRLGPMMRQPGMGRMTNLDLQTFMASVVGRDKPKEVNDSIRTAMGISLKNQLDYNQFAHNYFATHRTLQGASDAWDEYLAANPVFDPNAPVGSFHVNKGRVDYKTYFRSLHEKGHRGIVDNGSTPGNGLHVTVTHGANDFPDVTDADRNDPTFAGMTDEEIHNSKIPAKARGGPIRGYAEGGQVSDDPWPTLDQLRVRLAMINNPLIGNHSAYASPVQQDPGAPDVMALARLQQLMDTPVDDNEGAQQAYLKATHGMAGGGKVKADDDYQATLEDLARSVEQGGLFQWGDELNASVHPGPYSENITQERGKQERFAGSHPWSNTGLEMAGGAASTIALTKLAQLAARQGRGKAGALGALASLASRLTPTNPTLKAAVTGAGVGAASGAVSGAGSAQDMGSVPGMAAEQGTIGGILGPLSSLVTKYGVNGAMALVNKLTGRGVPAGNQRFINALGQDKITTDEIGTRLRAAQARGVPSMAANVGGPNVQALAQGVASKEGPQVTNFMDQVKQQFQSSNPRVNDLINKALKPDDYAQKLQELTTNLYQNAKPLYDAAYQAFPKVKSDAIYDILGNKYGKTAAKQAYNYMQADGVPIGQKDVTGAIRKPSLQYLDYVKRGLDDQIEAANRAGNTNLARIINGMKKRLVNELDTYTTDPKTGTSLYKEARGQYAGDKEVRDALQLGREDIQTMTPQEIRDKVANMSFAEKDALRTGAAENLFQVVGQTPVTSNAAAKLTQVPNVQERLAALFDKPSEYKQFMEGLQQEMNNFNQAKTLLSTQARSKAAGAASDLDPTGHLGEAAYEGSLAAAGHPLWAGARLAKAVGNRLMPNTTADAAADMLAIQNNPAGRTQLDMLKRQAALLTGQQNIGQTAGTAVAGATGPAMAPEPWGNTEPAYGDGGKVKGLKDFLTALSESVESKAADMKKLMDSLPFKYDEGQTVYTQKGVPYKILGRTTLNHYPEDVAAIKAGQPVTSADRAGRPPLPGYRVQAPDGSQFSIAEWGVHGTEPPTGNQLVN